MKNRLGLLEMFSVILVLGIMLGGCEKNDTAPSSQTVPADSVTVTFDVAEDSGTAPSSQTVPAGFVTVTFDAAEGGGTAPPPQIVPAGSVIRFPEQGDMIAPPGTRFAGWLTMQNTVYSHEYTVTEDIVFSAWWSWVFTVSFNTNGGTSIEPITEVLNHDTILLPDAPTKQGYTFAGWYTEKELINLFTKSQHIYKNITLYAKWVTVIENSSAGALVLIETEDFQREYFGDDKIRHNIKLSNDFYIGKYEVTQRLYEDIMGETSSYYTEYNTPMVNVSFYEAAAFCNALSEKEGLTPAYYISDNGDVSWTPGRNGYRLPTEAEWVYAFHGVGTIMEYGNVSEWCWDWYESRLPDGTWSYDRVVRRGNLNDTAEWMSEKPFARNDDLGFRVVRSNDQTDLQFQGENSVIALYGNKRIIGNIFRTNKGIEPIGWSRDGLFAYRAEWHDFGVPESGNSLIIFNTITDEVIINNRIVTSSSTPDYKFPDDEEIAQKRKEWQAMLTLHNIIGEIGNPASEIEEGEYSTHRGTDFNCWFDYETIFLGDSTLINWKLIAEVHYKQKIVSSGSESSESIYGSLEGKKILGYHKSPYENRIVIMTVDVRRGPGEYDEMTANTTLYGCHLDVGFEEKQISQDPFAI